MADPLMAAVEAGVAARIADRAFQQLRITESELDRWVIDLAISDAIVRWGGDGYPKHGPAPYLPECIAAARRHVQTSPHFADVRARADD